jgi:hypothetical protein
MTFSMMITQRDTNQAQQISRGTALLFDAIVAGIGLGWIWGSFALESQLCDPDCQGWPQPHTTGYLLVYAMAVLDSLGFVAGCHFALHLTSEVRMAGVPVRLRVCCGLARSA